MAYVTSMTYTTEAQFMEAIAQARSARIVRDNAKAAALAARTSSFQEILNASTAACSLGTSTTASTSNPSDLDAYFQEAADTYQISVDLLKAVAKQESGFQTGIVSSAGAIGVMQLMPSTASALGVSNPYDARENIMGGAKLLSQLSSRYNNNLDLMLAAYNAGTGSVNHYGGVPPYQETQNFISKIKSNLGLI